MARMWRRQVYLRASFFLKSKIIVLGQTQSDLLEKNFNNLFRGTSPNSFSKNKINFQMNSTEKFFPRLLLKNFHNTLFSKKRKNGSFFKHQFCRKYKYKRLKSPFHKNFYSFSNSIKSKNSSFFLKNKVLQKKYYFRTHKFSFLPSVNYKFEKNLNHPVMLGKKEKSMLLFPKDPLFWNKHFLEPKISQSYIFSFNHFEPEILKPLSKNSRPIIRRTVKILKYPVIIDRTNFSYSYSRNKLRHLLFPLIRDSFNRKFETRLLNFFTLIDEDNHYIEKLVLDFTFIFKLQEKILSVHPFNNVLENKILKNKNIIRPFFLQKMFIYNERTLSFTQIRYVQKTIFL